MDVCEGLFTKIPMPFNKLGIKILNMQQKNIWEILVLQYNGI